MQEELETYFADYLEGIDLAEVKNWYNGYSWWKKTVYNPYDILLFLNDPEKRFKSYWFERETPPSLNEAGG
ncbi:MAG: AAA family ATPase [Calditerrivibrio sp.]|nr:AAA family ATPase [Calditerrivibrio sp.]